MHPIKMVIADLDGTLLPPDGKIPEAAVNIINSLEERKVLFGIFTGRSPADAMEALRLGTCGFVEGLKLTAPCAFCNGAVAYLGGRELFCESFAAKSVRGLAASALSFGFSVAAVIGMDEYELRNELPSGYEGFLPLKKLSDLDDAARLLQLRIYSSRRELHLLEKELRDVSEHMSVSLYADRGCEITARNASKAAALARVCDISGISANNVLAVGDNVNDISMLKGAGMGIAVANAEALVKSAAAYTTSAAYTDGVLEALRCFVLS